MCAWEDEDASFGLFFVDDTFGGSIPKPLRNSFPAETGEWGPKISRKSFEAHSSKPLGSSDLIVRYEISDASSREDLSITTTF